MNQIPEPLAQIFHHLPSPFEIIPVEPAGYCIRMPNLGTARASLYCSVGLYDRRFIAAHRYEPFWMKPFVGTRIDEIPKETQLLFLELPDDRVCLLVPLSSPPEPGAGWRIAIEGLPGDESIGFALDIGVRSEAERTGQINGMYVHTGRRADLHELIRVAAQAVARLTGATLRESKPLPAFVDGFGWCTWDAFYQEVSHEKVREGLESFRDSGIQPRFMILDDGWQSEEDFGEDKGRRLTALAPNAKFSHDLAPTTRMAKEEFGIRTFLVWHAFQGYWGGISAHGLPQYHPQEIRRAYTRGILHHMPEADSKWWGTWAGIVPPGDIATFFNDYHRQLAAQGVDGVKVDNQAALEAFAAIDNTGRVPLYRAYHDALEASVAHHFSPSLPLINCMSCANDLLYGYSQSALTRTSADFYPQHAHLHGMHLWTNALVATWFGQFIQPDWDMFHSKHPFAAFHAAARAISGGPIYVSDKPGQHDAELLRKLVLSDGSVLRPDRPAMLTADALFSDPLREAAPLKVWSTRGGAGLLGLFNCHHEEGAGIRAKARVGDVPTLEAAQRYAVYAHRAAGFYLIGVKEAIEFELQPTEWELLTLVPVREGVAVLGLLDKFIGVGAIVSQALDEAEGERRLVMKLRDGGVLGVYCERPPARVMGMGGELEFEHAGGLLKVNVRGGGGQGIEVRWRGVGTRPRDGR